MVVQKCYKSAMRPYGYIYLLRCLVNGKGYIGQTIQRVPRRWQQHKSNKSGCALLRHALGKYGSDAFEVVVLDTATDVADLNQKECAWIAKQGTLVPDGYNLKKGGEGGGAATEQAKENMRQAHLGRKQSPELVEKRVAPLRGRKHPERSARLRESWESRSREVSDETRHKLVASHQGHVATVSTREKMSAAQKARRNKEATAGVQQHWSTESREVLRQAHLGKQHSEETRRKMSATHKARRDRLAQENET